MTAVLHKATVNGLPVTLSVKEAASIARVSERTMRRRVQLRKVACLDDPADGAVVRIITAELLRSLGIDPEAVIEAVVEEETR